MENQCKCPYCRAEIPKDYFPQVNKQLQCDIRARYPVEFQKKYQELEKNGLLIGDQIEVEFEIGNYFKKYD